MESTLGIICPAETDTVGLASSLSRWAISPESIWLCSDSLVLCVVPGIVHHGPPPYHQLKCPRTCGFVSAADRREVCPLWSDLSLWFAYADRDRVSCLVFSSQSAFSVWGILFTVPPSPSNRFPVFSHLEKVIKKRKIVPLVWVS